MLDSSGILVTNKNVIEDIALKTFHTRLENRPMKDDLAHIKSDKEDLCSKRLDMAKRNKTAP